MTDTNATAVGETTPNVPENDIPGLTMPDPVNNEAGDEQNQVAEKPPQKMVPYDALHEERQRRKELQSQLEADRNERLNRDRVVEERLARLTQAMQPQAPQINYQEDPTGFIAAQQMATNKEVGQLREMLQGMSQAAVQQKQIEQFHGNVNALEQAFIQKAPDYMEAINFAKTKRIEQLMLIGLSRDQAFNSVQQEAGTLAYQALQRGENAAEIGYEYAKSVGYVPKNASPKAQIESAQKGVEASRSLSSSVASKGSINLDSLSKMSAEEFDAYVNKIGWEKIAG